MSVSGEFQRYLAAAIETLEADAAANVPGVAALRDELEAARSQPETPLAERAKQSLAALAGHGLLASPEEGAADAADALPEIRESAAALASISRIVLGRDAPPAG